MQVYCPLPSTSICSCYYWISLLCYCSIVVCLYL
jgi:hypothetical protein